MIENPSIYFTDQAINQILLIMEKYRKKYGVEIVTPIVYIGDSYFDDGTEALDLVYIGIYDYECKDSMIVNGIKIVNGIVPEKMLLLNNRKLDYVENRFIFK